MHMVSDTKGHRLHVPSPLMYRCRTWIRTKIEGFKVLRPTVRRFCIDGLRRSRTSTCNHERRVTAGYLSHSVINPHAKYRNRTYRVRDGGFTDRVPTLGDLAGGKEPLVSERTSPGGRATPASPAPTPGCAGRYPWKPHQPI